MENQIFCDGIGRISVIGGVVRLDLFTYSPNETDANGQPRPILSHRIVMGMDGFVRSSEKVVEAVQQINRALPQQAQAPQRAPQPQPAPPQQQPQWPPQAQAPQPAPQQVPAPQQPQAQQTQPPRPPAPPQPQPAPQQVPPPIKPPFP